MNWQSIIELLIKQFSWPITIFIVIFIFKDKLDKVINFKTKDYEISFENEFKSIKRDMKDELRIAPNNAEESEWEVTSTASLKENMFELSEKSPLAVVLQAWSIMENTVIECAIIKGFNNINNPSAAIQYLYENKYIVVGYLNLYFRLYAIKERFSNFENEIVTKERALETADTIINVASDIKQCVNMIFENDN